MHVVVAHERWAAHRCWHSAFCPLGTSCPPSWTSRVSRADWSDSPSRCSGAFKGSLKLPHHPTVFPPCFLCTLVAKLNHRYVKETEWSEKLQALDRTGFRTKQRSSSGGKVTPTVSQAEKEHTAARRHLLWLSLYTHTHTLSHTRAHSQSRAPPPAPLPPKNTGIYNIASASLRLAWRWCEATVGTGFMWSKPLGVRVRRREGEGRWSPWARAHLLIDER